jgi:hypothetical protein
LNLLGREKCLKEATVKYKIGRPKEKNQWYMLLGSDEEMVNYVMYKFIIHSIRKLNSSIVVKSLKYKILDHFTCPHIFVKILYFQLNNLYELWFFYPRY